MSLDVLIIAMTLIAMVLVLYVALERVVSALRTQSRERRQFKTLEVLLPIGMQLVAPVHFIRTLPANRFYADDLTDLEVEARTEILRFLNTMEHLALTLNLGLIDAALAKRFIKTAVITSFKGMLSYVLLMRESSGNPRIYVEYETLARSWDDR